MGIVVSEMATGRSPFYTGSFSKMAYRATSYQEAAVQKSSEVIGCVREHPRASILYHHRLGGSGGKESTASIHSIQTSSGEQSYAVAGGKESL
ncbi:unnamed protein product [Ranitomeya imitator]|uniref:Uncharacterized protein n=1 Tax=Ranitomeya imitator TaxID=111125 RepID=A0ABN9MRL1_9NEOB|nr:unnamed protein product [Ranitomeya imitator]